MILLRRTLALSALATGLAAPRIARAQAGDWPNRPVRIVVPSAPAGSSDTAMRALVERLTANTGRPFFVENRAGLAGTIGLDHVAKSPPDGYSFVFPSTNAAVNETLQPRRPIVLLRDLVPVAAVNSLPLVFAVHNGLPAQDLRGLIEHARANPGDVNFASSGPGSMFHLSTEVLAAMAGVRMTHVPFRNYSEARTQLMAGQIQLMADATFTLEPLIRGGRMRGIATSAPQRTTTFPELPAVAELLPGYDFGLWNGLMAPAGTPRTIIERMNAEVNRVLTDPAFAEQNARMGVQLTPMTPEEFGTLIARDIDRMREAVRLANITPE
ncbi:MAG TPA: tripartite tricarboxylate transporter substrate-binding protein [Acetobacteraceae bacterium]|jgi:tripartite-type tricarboxylate transporter receptor subunit TctC|nr:tripartite tricarboxylate transporter substrate-binding protein [Acetobacteraceae bacterium]